MADQPGFFDKLKQAFSNLFSKPQPKPKPEIGPPPGARPLAELATPPSTPKPAPGAAPAPSPAASSGFSLTGLDVMATLINFARSQCGADYEPEIEVEKMFVIAPKNEESGSRDMIEWFLSHRPGLALMVMPQPGFCNVTLLYGPNPPTKGSGYLLGLNPVDSQKVESSVNALRAALETYVKQGTLVWQNGQWHYHKS
jgi:hypothetical protein